MAEPPSGDRLWDAWLTALGQQPDLDPSDFAERFGRAKKVVLESLEVLLEVQSTGPSPALIDLRATERFGRFRLLRILGQGTSGIVYLARDLVDRGDRRSNGGTDDASDEELGDAHATRTGRASDPSTVDVGLANSNEEDSEATGPADSADGSLVALKVLNPLLGVGERRREQLKREARIAATLRHEGIVSILDDGIERGYAWIAMEFIEGESLAAALSRGGDALGDRILSIALQIARALEYAHSRGVLHRDLKPANLIVTPSGRVKLLDFGLAQVEGAAFALSHTGEALGTPLYMAPEQLRGERALGPGVDLYALGLILLEMASGRRLATADQHLRSLARIAGGRFRIPTGWLACLSEPLAQVISRCTEPDPEDRYPDAAALVRDLEAIEHGDPLPFGRLRAGERWIRSVRRQPEVFARRALVLALTLVTLTFGAWRWRNRLVPVFFAALEPGSELLVDGESVGRVPCTVMLSPGAQTYRLLQGRPSLVYEYHGEFEVEHGRPSRIDLTHSSFYPAAPGNERCDLPGVDYSPGKWSWLQLAVKEERIHATLENSAGTRLFDREVSGVTALRVPFGDYRVRISHSDRVPIARDIHVSSSRLHVLSQELERAGRETRTIVVYSPLDAGLRDLRVDNARLHTGGRTQDSNTLLPATKVMFVPVDPTCDSEVWFRLDLPLENDERVERLELQVTSNPEVRDAEWVELWLGRSFEDEDMVLMGGTRDDRHLVGSQPHDELDDRLSRVMRDARTLCVRYRFGGCKPTSGEVNGGALRTNALPMRVDDRIVWDPALVLRLLPSGATWPTHAKDTPARVLQPPAVSTAHPIDDRGRAVEDTVLLWANHVPASGSRGYAYIVMGPSSEASGLEVLFEDGRRQRIERRTRGDGFGCAVVPLGDLDGDGTQELAIGAHDYRSEGAPGPGYVAAYRVLPERIERLDRIEGDRRGGGFGNHLIVAETSQSGKVTKLLTAGTGDHDGGWGSAHEVTLSESPGGLRMSQRVVARGWNQADHFGFDIALLPEQRSHGRRVLIGAYNEDPWGLDSGAVHVLDARTHDRLFTFEGDRVCGLLGKSVAAIDLDSDGVRELILTGRDELRVHEDDEGYPLRWRLSFDREGRFQRVLECRRDGVTYCVLPSREAGETYLIDAQGRCVERFGFCAEAFDRIEWNGKKRVLVGCRTNPAGDLEPIFLPDW